MCSAAQIRQASRQPYCASRKPRAASQPCWRNRRSMMGDRRALLARTGRSESQRPARKAHRHADAEHCPGGRQQDDLMRESEDETGQHQIKSARCRAAALTIARPTAGPNTAESNRATEKRPNTTVRDTPGLAHRVGQIAGRCSSIPRLCLRGPSAATTSPVHSLADQSSTMTQSRHCRRAVHVGDKPRSRQNQAVAKCGSPVLGKRSSACATIAGAARPAPWPAPCRGLTRDIDRDSLTPV